MVADARISAALPEHPKTKKLIRRLGDGAGWYLVRLFLWSAVNRSDGDLSGMSDEDIELAIGWNGEFGAFVRECSDVRFLDGDEGSRRLHDWVDHNPWAAGAEKRSEKGRWGALCKQYGRVEAERMMPGYAARMHDALPDSARGTKNSPTGSATGMHDALPDSARGVPLADSGSAPSPSPSPSPSPNTPLPPGGGVRRPRSDPGEEPEGFAAWYALYGRKDAKRDAIKAWRQLDPDDVLQARMIAALVDWPWNPDRTKIPMPATWLRGRRWEDEAVTRAASATVVPEWCRSAGFDNVFDASNAGCWAHTAARFRDGKPLPEGASA